jgi:ubiquinone/menaquinone biosynthesis C-methylase UbiE
MSNLDATFVGSIPALYERCLSPFLFEPYAGELAQRVRKLGPRRILETAAGTGIVTRVLARALPEAEIIATDLNQAMLDLAATKLQAPHVKWQQADAQSLPFDDAKFDLVVCQFGVMFFPDKQRGYQEARRVLRPGGRFLFNVWDKIENNEIGYCVAEAVKAVFPSDPPNFLARTPYGYFDQGPIRDALRQAGFDRIEVETVQMISRAPSPQQPAIGLCQGSPLRNEIEVRDASRLEEATKKAAEAVAARYGAGEVTGRMQALVITATA